MPSDDIWETMLWGTTRFASSPRQSVVLQTMHRLIGKVSSPIIDNKCKTIKY